MSLNPKQEKSERELSEAALRKIDTERAFQQDALTVQPVASETQAKERHDDDL